MKRREFLTAVGVGAMGMRASAVRALAAEKPSSAKASSSAKATEDKPAGKPNIILIMSDDMGYSASGVMAARSTRRASTVWRPTGCGSRISTTPPAVARPARA